MAAPTPAWDITTRVAGGRVCSVATGLMAGTPEQLWRLLACPESAPLFRVARRQQLTQEGPVITEEVVFLAAVRIVFWKRWAKTSVRQTVDFTNPQAATVAFELLRSDMMSHLTGGWLLEQVSPASEGRPALTRVTYDFSMWPKGVPVALRFMPGLIDAVRAAVSRESEQLFDKLAFVAGKVAPDGSNLLAAAAEASDEIERAGGSFKCLQALLAGDVEAAAAAAAAEAAARRQLLEEHVECHALECCSDEEEDVAAAAAGGKGSCSSSSSSFGSLASSDEASDEGQELTASDSALTFRSSDSSADDGVAAAAESLAAGLKLAGSPTCSSSSSSSSNVSQPDSPAATVTIRAGEAKVQQAGVVHAAAAAADVGSL